MALPVTQGVSTFSIMDGESGAADARGGGRRNSTGEHRPDMSTIRRTLLGMAWGGGLFAALSVYRSLVGGGPFLQHLNPIGIMTVIGATVGGLIGPLVGAALEHRRGNRRRGG